MTLAEMAPAGRGIPTGGVVPPAQFGSLTKQQEFSEPRRTAENINVLVYEVGAARNDIGKFDDVTIDTKWNAITKLEASRYAANIFDRYGL